jgi:hypothetical protein
VGLRNTYFARHRHSFPAMLLLLQRVAQYTFSA